MQGSSIRAYCTSVLMKVPYIYVVVLYPWRIFFLSGIATSILGKVALLAIEHGAGSTRLAWNIKKELEKLKNSMEAICAVLRDAERKQSTSDSHKVWLGNLSDVIYDIDDVLDDVTTQTLRKKVEKVLLLVLAIYSFFLFNWEAK